MTPWPWRWTTLQERADSPVALIRVTGLARVTGQLVGAADLATVTEIVLREAALVAGAGAAMLAVREGEQLRPLGLHGQALALDLVSETFSLEEHHPMCEAVRTGRSVILLGADAVARDYPVLAGDEDRSVVCMPLTPCGSAPFGALGFRFDGPGSQPGPFELQLLEVVADACTQALSRIDAQQLGAERARRLQFLSDASIVLASSLDHRETLTTVARLAVPEFADRCTVEMLEDGRLRTLAVAHVEVGTAPEVGRHRERLHDDPDVQSRSREVARTGVSARLEQVRSVASDPDDAGIRCDLIVPLTARGRVFGVMTFAAYGTRRAYGPEEMTFAEDLARRAALAIDNADLFSQTQHAAQVLQRALSPQRLPDVAGWEMAAVNRPSGRTDVGGDFYDVIPLPGRRLAVVIGDVMGRGVDAAGASSRLRSAVRAYVADDPDPSRIATSLDRLMELDPSTPLVTMAYLLFDPAADMVDVLIAGHLPPFVVAADGAQRILCSGGSPPFGVRAVTRTSQRVPCRVGDLVLLYTDGLAERRDEDIDVSLARLGARIAEIAIDDVQVWLTTLADAMAGPGSDDDVALLAVRRTS